MARALKKIMSTALKKPKKRAVSFATLKLGDEPSFICEPTTAELVRALNWYTQCVEDPETHKAWVTEFLANRGWKADDIRTVTAKIKKMVGTHIFIARMFNRHLPLDIKYDAEATDYFERELAKHEEELDDDGQPIVKAPPVRANSKVAPLVHFIDAQIEQLIYGTADAEPVYPKLVAYGCNAAVASQLKSIFKATTAEFTELSKSYTCGEDLDEAYKHVSKANRKELGDFVKKLNADLDSFAAVVKATRKPRKKKPVRAEKLVARVRYQKRDDTYKIASVEPIKIIGAAWVWTFNTKYRILSWYEGDTGGLSVKGTTITNFKASGQKKLRKPEEQLPKFAGTVKALPRQFDLIKTTEVEAVGRLNNDTIIFKVFS